MSKKIKLTKGYFAIVDDDLYEKLNKFKWHVQINKKSKTQYVTRHILKN